MTTHTPASGAPASSMTYPSMRQRPGSGDGVGGATLWPGTSLSICAVSTCTESIVTSSGVGAGVPGGVVRGVGIALASGDASGDELALSVDPLGPVLVVELLH